MADEALRLFSDHFAIAPDPDPLHRLRSVLRAFARLPYENLSKIVTDEEAGSACELSRSPADVLRAHVAGGTGGTCFLLTATLRHLVHALGFEAEPVLADRPYGVDTHCALAVRIDGKRFLVDPGYLLVDPIPLDGRAEQRVPTSFHEVLLVPRADGGRMDLHTVTGRQSSLRLTFKTDPVDRDRFTKAWQASFGWEMMRYPVVTQVIDGRHVYLQGNRLQARGRDGTVRQEIAPAELAARISATFGIAPGVVARALAILARRGERHGEP